MISSDTVEILQCRNAAERSRSKQLRCRPAVAARNVHFPTRFLCGGSLLSRQSGLPWRRARCPCRGCCPQAVLAPPPAAALALQAPAQSQGAAGGHPGRSAAPDPAQGGQEKGEEIGVQRAAATQASLGGADTCRKERHVHLRQAAPAAAKLMQRAARAAAPAAWPFAGAKLHQHSASP